MRTLWLILATCTERSFALGVCQNVIFKPCKTLLAQNTALKMLQDKTSNHFFLCSSDMQLIKKWEASKILLDILKRKSKLMKQIQDWMLIKVALILINDSKTEKLAYPSIEMSSNLHNGSQSASQAF